MKKSLLPLVVSAVLPVSGFAAGPIDGDVYGKINLSLESIDLNKGGVQDDTNELQSNASRIGVKGKTELSDGLYVIYKMEWEVQVDDGDSDLTSRNRYLGLAGGFGTLIAGQHDTPHKLAQNKVDLFNDLAGDIKNLLDSENRAKNIVMYSSPDFSGFGVTAAWIASEEDGQDDGTSIAVKYEQGGLYLSAAFEADVEAEGTDSVRLVAQYQLDAFQIGALWEENDVDGLETQDALHLSLAYKMDKVTLKTQYTMSEIAGSASVSSVDGDEADMWSLGADYKLGKQTKAFAYYTMIENDEGGSALYEKDVFGIGMEHKF